MSPPSSSTPSSLRRRVTIDTARGWELKDETPTDFDRKMNAIQDNKHMRKLFEIVETKYSPDVLELVHDSIRDTKPNQSACLPDYSVYKESLKKLHTAALLYPYKSRYDHFERWSIQHVVSEVDAWTGRNSIQARVEEAASSTEGENKGG